ncbi:MAG: VOC family protein [Chloroflexi bacterium]|nr:VOC family protein [Chloroflexota bacterium]
MRISLDHVVIAVTDWQRSNAFYRDVLGATVVPRGGGFAYRFGAQQLNAHGPGVTPSAVARDPVRPGNSDLCFEWSGPIADAVAHLERQGIAPELGPLQKEGARGIGSSVYLRDPDGTLIELISYHLGSDPQTEH